MTPRLVLVVVLCAFAVLFLVQNVGVMEIRFFFWSFSMSRSLLLLFVLLIGVGIGALWASFAAHRRRKDAGL